MRGVHFTAVAFAISALLPLAAPTVARADWLVSVDSYTDVRFQDELRNQLAAYIGEEEGVREDQAMMIASLALGLPHHVFLLPKFCTGCQIAHYWLVNLSDEPLFAIDVEVELRRDAEGEPTQRALFLPMVPARSAVRIGFPIPWPMQEMVEYRFGEPPPPSHTVMVRDSFEIAGLPLGLDAAQALSERAGSFALEPTDELVAGGQTDSILFSLTHLEDDAADRFAMLLAQSEGGEATRERALHLLRRGASSHLANALPEEELDAFVASAVSSPGALARILRDVSTAQAAALSSRLRGASFEARDALIRATVRSEDPDRFALFAAALAEEQDPLVLAQGWKLLESGPLIDAQLSFLRDLERGDAHRQAAATVLARRYLDGAGIPRAATGDFQRLKDAAPDAFAAVYSDILSDRGPFTAEALDAGSVDVYTYLTRTLRTLEGCDVDEQTLEDAERCAAAIATDPELAAVAAGHHLSPHYLASVVAAIRAETSPDRRAEVGELFLSYGVDGNAIAEAMCGELSGMMYDHQGAWIDAARRVDPAASCVAEADSLILGLSPLWFFIVLAVFLAVVALLVVGVRAHRKRQREVNAMMLDALDDVGGDDP